MRWALCGLVWVLAAGLLAGCSGGECRSETVDIHFKPSPHAQGLFLADVLTDRCEGEGTEEWRYEVECEGTCPSYTARVFLDSYMIAEEPSAAPYTEIVAHESHTPNVNEYELYVETDPDVSPDQYRLHGRFTGAQAELVP